MNNRIEIDLGFAKLAVEQGTDPYYPREVYVGLEKDGQWLQDIAVIGQHYHYGDDKTVSDPLYDEGIRVLVFGSEHSEDYTEEFNIGIYKEET